MQLEYAIGLPEEKKQTLRSIGSRGNAHSKRLANKFLTSDFESRVIGRGLAFGEASPIGSSKGRKEDPIQILP
jgi:hypothetical protein